jgi:hypothetical protein
LLPFTGTSEDVQSYSSGPHEPRVGLDCPFVLLPRILPLSPLRRRSCVCACLTLLPLDVSVYLSIFSVRLPSKLSATKKQRQGQS